MLRRGAQAIAGFLAPRVGGVVANIAGMVGSLFVTLFALFFLMRDGDRVVALIRRILPFPEKERERLMTETQDLVIASVGAGLAVAAVQGTIGGVTFWAMGLPAPVAWGVAIGICSLIPVVGATLVWVPVALWWLLSGAVMKALILTGIGAGVIGMVDNILRPMILSGRASVNGLVVFIGLLGGVGAFGFVGLVLGPIILVTAGTLIDALTRRSAHHSGRRVERRRTCARPCAPAVRRGRQLLCTTIRVMSSYCGASPANTSMDVMMRSMRSALVRPAALRRQSISGDSPNSSSCRFCALGDTVGEEAEGLLGTIKGWAGSLSLKLF